MMIRGSIGVFQFCDAHLIFIMEGVCPLHRLIGGNETIVRFAWTQTWSRLHITIVVMMVFLNTIMIMAMMVIWTIEMIMRRKMFLPLHGFYFRCLLQPECFCQNLFLTFLSWNMWERIWFGQFFYFLKYLWDPWRWRWWRMWQCFFDCWNTGCISISVWLASVQIWLLNLMKKRMVMAVQAGSSFSSSMPDRSS